MILGADALVRCQQCNLYIKRTESAGHEASCHHRA
jgi:hypothetical protein